MAKEVVIVSKGQTWKHKITGDEVVVFATDNKNVFAAPAGVSSEVVVNLDEFYASYTYVA
jgi:hypothetical protein